MALFVSERMQVRIRRTVWRYRPCILILITCSALFMGYLLFSLPNATGIYNSIGNQANYVNSRLNHHFGAARDFVNVGAQNAVKELNDKHEKLHEMVKNSSRFLEDHAEKISHLNNQVIDAVVALKNPLEKDISDHIVNRLEKENVPGKIVENLRLEDISKRKDGELEEKVTTDHNTIRLNEKNVSVNKTAHFEAKNITEPKVGHWENIKKHVSNLKDTVKNKTIESFDAIRNKTKESLNKFGVMKADEKAQETVYKEGVLNFNLSKQAIVQYMEFLNTSAAGGLSNIKHYHSHAQPFIRDGLSYIDKSLTIKEGLCVCNQSVCMCCGYLEIQKLALHSKPCIQLVYIPKPQKPMMQLQFFIGGSSVLNESVSAFEPQEICMGGSLSSMEMCLSFQNTTVRMPSHDNTATSVSSCISFVINLFMKSVAVFPAGCFTITSSNSLKDDLHVNKVGHQFVP